MRFRKIMLIDDDEDDQEIFEAAITSISANVDLSVFSDARKALITLNDGTLPEVIFLDLNMPVMNGQEFLIIIKQSAKLSHIPVIIFTTSSNPSSIEIIMQLGAFDFITKPASIGQLIRILTPFVA